MESKKNINGMDYVLAGDYYIPDLKLPNEERPIGKYGRMHLEYLKEHSPMRFNDLVLEGQLWTYLADLNEQTQERLSLIVEQMKVSEGVTEELKAADQMAWIRAMNSIHNRAEEIVLEEIVYRLYLAGLHFRWSPAFYIQKQYFLRRQKVQQLRLECY